MRVDDVDGIRSAARERLHDTVHDLGGIGRRGPIADVDPARCDGAPDVAIVPQSLAADRVQLDLDALSLEPRDQIPALANEIRVERAGKPTVPGDQDDGGAARLTRLPQKWKALRELRRVQARHDVT